LKKIAKEKGNGEKKAPSHLNKKPENKSFSKILLDVLENPKNECDHFKSDLGFFPCSWIFQKFKQ
jgi:hypothetical protein